MVLVGIAHAPLQTCCIVHDGAGYLLLGMSHSMAVQIPCALFPGGRERGDGYILAAGARAVSGSGGVAKISRSAGQL